MRQKSIKLALIFLFFSVHFSSISADSFRCGRKLIKTGDSNADVIRVCGEPRHKDRGYEKIRVDGVSRDTRVERWYYKRSSRSLEHIILIYRGKVSAVEVGNR